VCIAAAQFRLHTKQVEADNSSNNRPSKKAGTAVLGESQYTPAKGRRTCPASYLTFAGPVVHIPVSLGRECSFFRVNFVISSHMRDISRARTLYIANVVLLPEQRDKDIQMLIYSLYLQLIIASLARLSCRLHILPQSLDTCCRDSS